MRLGAFLLYNEYTVSRHQQVGRSTCRVHPCKQEKTGSASACAVANPSFCQPLGSSLPATPLFYQDDSGIGNLQAPPITGGHTHTHTRCLWAALLADSLQGFPVVVPYHFVYPKVRTTQWCPRCVFVPFPVSPFAQPVLQTLNCRTLPGW